VISVLVQIQYRTSALATILVALHLILVEVAGLNGSSAWWLVVGLTAATTIYAAWGGLKTVAATDALLGCVMLVATVVLWVCLWQQAGGWSGATAAIAQRSGPDVARQLGHIGAPLPDQPAPLVMLGGWILIVTGYFVVNHTQTMKMLGVRSMWDLKMSVLVGAGLIMISGLLSGTIGYFGRALLPGLDHPDLIYPRLVGAYLGTGLKGVVVAGVVASAVSTLEGIGAALAALFTRDIYARLLVRSASDAHYLRVSRLSTVVVVAGSFLYVPLILRADGIVSFFVGITSVLVTPLLTIYLVGVLTGAHRRSAMFGLAAGFAYGLAAFFTREGYVALPDWLTEKFAAFLWSATITGTAMWAASPLLSGEPREEEPREGVLGAREDERPLGKPWHDPRVWAAVLLVAASVLVFGVFW
jgi:SSS family solute:Na+ symporter